MAIDRIVIGTRKSKLALWQSNYIKTRIEKLFPDIKVELVKIVTKGDRILDTPLARIGDNGLFTKEIEKAIMDRHVDIAVHSLKDVSTSLPDGLKLMAYSKREDPRDALLANRGLTLDTLPSGSTIGTSSLRRISQIRICRPDLTIKDLRGNVDTRIKKLESGAYDAIILAAAGLRRLGLDGKITQLLPVTKMIPSICQGIMAIEGRNDDNEIEAIVRKAINDRNSETSAAVERGFLKKVEGGCQVPLGCYSKPLDDKRIFVIGFIGDLKGKYYCRESGIFPLDDPESIGMSMADRLLNAGGRRILEGILRQ